MERKGIYPGTFDPITVGHMDIISRALKVVDKLIIAVALDTTKQPIFPVEVRAEMIHNDVKEALGADANRVEIKTFHGLLVDLAEQENTNMIIRGLRAVSDFEYEFQMSCMNSSLKPDIETVFLTASDDKHFIASSLVKQVAKLGGDISSFVSPAVEAKLKEHFA